MTGNLFTILVEERRIEDDEHIQKENHVGHHINRFVGHAGSPLRLKCNLDRDNNGVKNGRQHNERVPVSAPFVSLTEGPNLFVLVSLCQKSSAICKNTKILTLLLLQLPLQIRVLKWVFQAWISFLDSLNSCQLKLIKLLVLFLEIGGFDAACH